MSVEVIENGNIFNSKSTYLVNAVNCVGIMGAGIAKAFADKYPKMYDEYKTLCKVGVYEIGKPRIHQVDGGKYVINFPTMKYPGSKSNLIDIVKGLQYLKTRLKQDYDNDNTPLSVAFCALGCGVGKLSVYDVLNEVEKTFKYTNWCNVEFYLPEGYTNTKNTNQED